MSSNRLPPPKQDQVYVEVSAVEAGHLTLPEHLFVTDADPEKRVTVPSLAFLIKHPSKSTPSQPATILFDLGLKRDLSAYPKAMHAHIAKRQPCSASPDAAASLRAANLDPESDIDYVILSHTHWDHVGTPTDFPNSQFIVGSSTMHLLTHGAPPHYPRETFDPDLLPVQRTLELPPVPNSPRENYASPTQTNHSWSPLSTLPNTIDIFNDGSFYLIDAPGHLHGHINALARLGADRWVYLGGDCCHDTRILSGEKGIGMYDDGHGGARSVHVDTDAAQKTVDAVRDFLKVNEGTVEAVIAHGWEWKERHPDKFLPGKM